MNISSDPFVWIAAILTLCVFSFLYKDNPLFCFAEHLLVGLSTGFLICTYWHNVLFPELIVPLRDGGLGPNAHLIGAAVLCFFWACRFVEKLEDLYRLALAFWISIEMGMMIPTFMESQILSQISGSLDVSLHGAPVDVVGNLVLSIGTACALAYFFFSRAHTGIVGASAKVGIWILMVGFGASFSYTIMSRVYVLIGRVLFLLRDWLGIVQ
jgi:hypothetical protein